MSQQRNSSTPTLFSASSGLDNGSPTPDESEGNQRSSSPVDTNDPPCITSSMSKVSSVETFSPKSQPRADSASFTKPENTSEPVPPLNYSESNGVSYHQQSLQYSAPDGAVTVRDFQTTSPLKRRIEDDASYQQEQFQRSVRHFEYGVNSRPPAGPLSFVPTSTGQYIPASYMPPPGLPVRGPGPMHATEIGESFEVPPAFTTMPAFAEAPTYVPVHSIRQAHEPEFKVPQRPFRYGRARNPVKPNSVMYPHPDIAGRRPTYRQPARIPPAPSTYLDPSPTVSVRSDATNNFFTFYAPLQSASFNMMSPQQLYGYQGQTNQAVSGCNVPNPQQLQPTMDWEYPMCGRAMRGQMPPPQVTIERGFSGSGRSETPALTSPQGEGFKTPIEQTDERKASGHNTPQ